MARENFEVEVPDGTHLGFSRDTEGAYRAHLFDDETNELVGHAELFEPDLSDDDPSSGEDAEVLAQFLAALALLGVIVGAQKAAPYVKQWWNNKAVPFLKGRRSPIDRTPAEHPDPVASTLGVTDREPAAQDDVFSALDEYRASMSSAEARERFIAALVARLFSEKQLQILKGARIEDAQGALGLASAMAALTPQQFEDSVREMLEENPSWPDQETEAELSKLLSSSLEQPAPALLTRDRQIDMGASSAREE